MRWDIDWRPSLLGGVDGVITSVAILSASFLTDLTRVQTIAVSLSTLVADAVSMGASEYLSSSDEGREEATIPSSHPSSSNPNPGGRRERRIAAGKRGLLCAASFLLSGSLPLSLSAAAHQSGQAVRFSVLIGTALTVATAIAFLRHRTISSPLLSSLAETLLLVGAANGIAVATNLVVQAVG